jgi:hypothetical protein
MCLGVACGPCYPLQVLITLRFIPGFPLLSLTRIEKRNREVNIDEVWKIVVGRMCMKNTDKYRRNSYAGYCSYSSAKA